MLNSDQMKLAVGIWIFVMVMPIFVRLIKEPPARMRKYIFLFQAVVCLLGVGYLLKIIDTLGLRLALLAFGAIWIIFFGVMAKTSHPAELLDPRNQPKSRKGDSR